MVSDRTNAPPGLMNPIQEIDGMNPIQEIDGSYGQGDFFTTFVNQKALCMVTHALVTSQLEYHNTVYLKQPLKYIQKLKLIQNAASRATMDIPQYAHVTVLLYTLHWMPTFMCHSNNLALQCTFLA